jgi:hypothetical protein
MISFVFDLTGSFGKRVMLQNPAPDPIIIGLDTIFRRNFATFMKYCDILPKMLTICMLVIFYHSEILPYFIKNSEILAKYCIQPILY